MDQYTHVIKFKNVSDAEAAQYAEELRDFLLDATADVEAKKRRDDPYTQDLGTTLVLVLGTPAAVAVAEAIGNWLALRRGTITIKRGENGEVLECSGTNLSENAQLEMVRLFTQK